MILVLLLVFVSLLVAGIIIHNKVSYDREWIGFMIGSVGGICAFVCLIAAIVLMINCIYYSTIDERIEMYQVENEQIETTIKNMAVEYQQYESDYVENLVSKDLVEMVLLCPELGSSRLVESQMNLYIENNKTIKELKEVKITASIERWWLYFGG